MKNALVLATLALSACSYDPNEEGLSHDVGRAFEPCNAAEIRYLAGKHNFMSAFEPCGSNNFSDYAWAPDGIHLYFSLENGGARVMDADAEDKRNYAVPTESPTGHAAWITRGRIALPLPPADDTPGAPQRISIFDIDQKTLFTHEVPGYRALDHLQGGRGASELFFVAEGPDGRTVYRMNVDDGAIDRPFPWLGGEIDTFTFQPKGEAVVVGRGDRVTAYRPDGFEIGTWSPARRGVMHPENRWLALEHDADPVSIFYQRSWDELSENARRRELARAKRFEDQLPDWVQKEVEPPTLSLVDLTTEERWVFTGFNGHQFQWYPMDYYVSFILWGFEGKQLNRNVVLGNLADRMRSVERGEAMMGVEPWKAPGAAPAAGVTEPVATEPVEAPPATEPPAIEAPSATLPAPSEPADAPVPPG